MFGAACTLESEGASTSTPVTTNQTFVFDLTTPDWFNTGIYVPSGFSFSITASGVGTWNGTQPAYPEGVYADQQQYAPFISHDSVEASSISSWPISGNPMASGANIKPFDLVLAISNTKPSTGYNQAQAPGRGPITYVSSGGYIWIVMNDIFGQHYDNTGTWSITITTSGLSSSGYQLKPLIDTTANATSGSSGLLQNFWEAFVNEKEYLYPHLVHLQASRTLFYDVSEPRSAWLIESFDTVEKLEVKDVSGSKIDVPMATSDLELFYSSNWKWKQDDTVVLIYGLAIKPIATERRVDDWQYIKCSNLWTSGSMSWMEHPKTKNWIPLHPNTIREDGFLGYNFDGNVRFRNLNSKMEDSLDEVTIYINGVEKTARRVQIFNSLDDKGRWFNLTRRDKESNQNFSEVILQTSWFRSQSRKGLRNFISAALRTGTTKTITATTSSFTIPVSSTGYSIRNIEQYNYVQELNVTPSSDNRNEYLSVFKSPDMGSASVRNVITEFNKTVSGTILFDSYVDNQSDAANINWRLKYWTENGSSITFTDNFPNNVPDLIIFFPSKVRVNIASTSTLRKSFDKRSPIFRWRSSLDEEEYVQGLAEFDF